MKLNSNGTCIIVKKSPYRKTGLSFAIVHSDNPFTVEPYQDPQLSDESNRDEFEKAYGAAQFQLAKTNVEQ